MFIFENSWEIAVGETQETDEYYQKGTGTFHLLPILFKKGTGTFRFD
ncbi:MAG: hypothetical protein LBT53_05660 [Puniceicoccales bacterium]|jgi:hypothetical protein|nr:hypothetical protein [Puniceicoccales bacterium]